MRKTASPLRTANATTIAVSISATIHRLTIAEKYGKYGRYGKYPRGILLSLPSLLSETFDRVIAPCVPLCGLSYRRSENKPTAKHTRIWANVCISEVKDIILHRLTKLNFHCYSCTIQNRVSHSSGKQEKGLGLLKHPCRVTAAGNADRKPFLGTPCAF